MNQAVKKTPYIIKSEPVAERYGRGWYCLGKAKDYTSTPVTLNYFGKRLVAYRGETDNTVHVLDSYCPHMGLPFPCLELGWRWRM
jgi:3-ketosteroid 9alpha-monooxygenase subunit A